MTKSVIGITGRKCMEKSLLPFPCQLTIQKPWAVEEKTSELQGSNGPEVNGRRLVQYTARKSLLWNRVFACRHHNTSASDSSSACQGTHSARNHNTNLKLWFIIHSAKHKAKLKVTQCCLLHFSECVIECSVPPRKEMQKPQSCPRRSQRALCWTDAISLLPAGTKSPHGYFFGKGSLGLNRITAAEKHFNQL